MELIGEVVCTFPYILERDCKPTIDTTKETLTFTYKDRFFELDTNGKYSHLFKNKKFDEMVRKTLKLMARDMWWQPLESYSESNIKTTTIHVFTERLNRFILEKELEASKRTLFEVKIKKKNFT